MNESVARKLSEKELSERKLSIVSKGTERVKVTLEPGRIITMGNENYDNYCDPSTNNDCK